MNGEDISQLWRKRSIILGIKSEYILKKIENLIVSFYFRDKQHDDDFYYILVRFVNKLYSDNHVDIIPMLKIKKTLVCERKLIRMLVNGDINICI